jgi:hypothetical protein
MSHLWIFSSTTDDAASSEDGGSWARHALAAAVTLTPGTHLQRAATPDGTQWIVVGPPSLRVNGEPVAGIAVLADRDVIGIDGQSFFFSTESLAEIVAFPPRERPVRCARCRAEIARGTPAVACPRCGAWHHQTEELPCWTHLPTCAEDATPTSLDAGLRFTPEEL